MFKRPFIIRGVALIAGFAWSAAHRKERPVSAELMAFRRKEQMSRLRGLFTRRQLTESAGTAQRAQAAQTRTP
jgi:hypothetical protein